MKYLAGLLLPLLFVSNLFASNLCDSSCDLSITFPDGGSIEAVKPLTITFGEGGFITDQGVTTAYPDVDTISLAAGESIDFEAGGEIDLGNGGNIDYSDILIMSNGVMDLAAVEGSKSVTVQDMTLLGGCVLNISSNFEVVESGTFHIFSGPVRVSTGLVYTNHGSVSGLFEFESVVLTLEDKTYDITGSVLIEVDGQLSMTSEEVVIKLATVVADNTPEGTSDAGSSAAAASAGSGLISFLSLLLMPLLLVILRLKCVSSKSTI